MASPVTAGYFTVVEGGVEVIGGTSAATPIWAGIVALANQSAGADGLGAINAKLYALGSRQYGGSGVTVFRGVRSGDNDFNDVAGFAAGFGYDLASGLGTPVVDSLVRAFAPAACAGDCSGDGAVTIDELVTAVQIALGAIPTSVCTPLDADRDGRIS